MSKRYDTKSHTQKCEILHDPMPAELGGFAPGSQIPMIEFRYTLREGHFSSGTIVRVESRYYRIVGTNKFPVSLNDGG